MKAPIKRTRIPKDKNTDQSKNPNSWLKYINIPITLFGNPELSYIDMFLFAFIDLLDGNNGCFASNAYFANLMDTSESTITNSISKLVKLNYIKKTSFDGRKRTLRINYKFNEKHKPFIDLINKKFKGRVVKSSESPSQKSQNIINTNIINTNLINNISSKEDITLFEKVSNDIIYQIISFWNTIPNVTKHKYNPDSKTIKTISVFLNNLLTGEYITSNKGGLPKKKLIEFFKNKNIPDCLHTKKWDKDEIQDILKSTQSDQNISAKSNLKDVLFNDFNGFSLFYIKANESNVSDEYKDVARQLAISLDIKLSSVTLERHALLCRDIIEENNTTIDNLNDVLLWYRTGKENKYTPKARDTMEFKDKYDRIVAAKQNDGTGQSKQTIQPVKELTRESLCLYDYEKINEAKKLYNQEVSIWFNSGVWPSSYSPDKEKIFTNLIEIKRWIVNVIHDRYYKIRYHLQTIHEVTDRYIDWIMRQSWLDEPGRKFKNEDFMLPGHGLFKLFMKDLEGDIDNTKIRSRGWGDDEDIPMETPDEKSDREHKEDQKYEGQQELEKKNKQKLISDERWAISHMKAYLSDWKNAGLKPDVMSYLVVHREEDWKTDFKDIITKIEKEHLKNPRWRKLAYYVLFQRYSDI